MTREQLIVKMALAFAASNCDALNSTFMDEDGQISFQGQKTEPFIDEEIKAVLNGLPDICVIFGKKG